MQAFWPPRSQSSVWPGVTGAAETLESAQPELEAALWSGTPEGEKTLINT